MQSYINELSLYMNVLVLIFSRLTGMLIIAPIFGRNNLPNIFKLAIALAMSIVVLPATLEWSEQINQLDFGIVVLFSIKEFLIGLLIGYIFNLFFSAFLIAGGMIDMDIGFAVARIIDPQGGVDTSVTGNFLYIFATLIFLILDGHHQMLKLIVKSFELLPVQAPLNLGPAYMEIIIRLIGDVFIYSIKLAVPIIITIFIVNMVLGILARTMPQMNVFIVGMPLKIFVGMLVMNFIILRYDSSVKGIINGGIAFVLEILHILRGV
ncbi:flagellar biosynthetic protein FliR [Peptoclostridium litorale DSM 5388]|uniref:Flagellar biosynthetic protein FliR n=2 Tax=Peptoclostridium litorale TaxID=1557 RepID=A0A069REI3_PEPLI|nr:flagellar biosynthetic protein FliR [Peptoclostridium litorale DSM 5388]SIN73764.1 flagellar biosynthetic protein FliR [Peptoclostridium litorale DSM 5388]